MTGLNESDAWRLTTLEAENARLKKLLAEAMGLGQALVVDVGVFPLSSDGAKVDRLFELEDWQAEGAF